MHDNIRLIEKASKRFITDTESRLEFFEPISAARAADLLQSYTEYLSEEHAKLNKPTSSPHPRVVYKASSKVAVALLPLVILLSMVTMALGNSEVSTEKYSVVTVDPIDYSYAPEGPGHAQAFRPLQDYVGTGYLLLNISIPIWLTAVGIFFVKYWLIGEDVRACVACLLVIVVYLIRQQTTILVYVAKGLERMARELRLKSHYYDNKRRRPIDTLIAATKTRD